MAGQLLSLKNIHLTFGGTPLLEGAELSVLEGDRICLVGRNGSGKSTLMRIAAGSAEADAGERFVHPGARVRYLPQDADFAAFETALAYVESGLDATDSPHLARMALEEVGIDPATDPNTLSGGEARRVAIARVLAPQPEVLLLDEPTNHLDLPAIEWLEGRLAALGSAIVLISHDRRMLETLSRATVWLDRGLTRHLDRGFAHFEAWRDKVLEEDEIERHKLDRKIEREERWMHSGGVTARRKRNMRRVAELAALRSARREARQVIGNVRMAATEAGQSGKLVIEAKGLSKDFGAGPVVLDFSLAIARGDRVGLVGPNGAGKTTLIKLLTGQMQPDSGTLRLGTNLEIVTLDQRREALDPEERVADVLTGGRSDWVDVNGQRKHVASYLADFLFLPEQSRSPVKVLSGGEKARLLLARALAKPSNLLVLDEPTNDLDMETLDLLQELLSDYTGTLILVSHDRDFLDRVVTSVIATDGEGRWVEYAGGYSDMLSQRKGTAPAQRTAAGASKARPAAKTESRSVQSEPRAKRKLSFKEKHALDTLPGQIARLEAEIAALNSKVGDAGLYGRDPAGFHAASTRLAAAQAELHAAEELWLELEMLREELEG
jgi:ATP-binding cassette subfamily F protein uup